MLDSPSTIARMAAVLAALALSACDEEPPQAPAEPAPTHGAITVEVFFEDQPVAGALVAVYRDGFAVESGASTANGRRIFDGLEPGQYQVSATPPQGLHGGGVRTVEVVAGAMTKVAYEMEKELVARQPRGHIHVQVLEDSTSGVGGATIRLYHHSNFDQPRRVGVTDADGWVYFNSLAGGGWAFELELPQGYEMTSDYASTEGFANVLPNTTAIYTFHVTRSD